ncbi:MAG: SPOR domain-containing protein [Myxococcales bacterium]|nr:SPOR domain-containing protein [Myxococcales bacterium]
MREMHKWKDKVELSLDNRQIFFLFFGLSVVGCFVFALGVMVGRRVDFDTVAEADAEPGGLALLDAPTDEPTSYMAGLRGDGEPESAAAPLALPAAADAEPAADVDDVEPPQPGSKPGSKAAVAKPGKGPAAKPTAAGVPGDDATMASAKPAIADSRKFTLQMKAFAKPEEAEAFAAPLRANGHEVRVEAHEIKGRVWHRVRMGEFDTWEEGLAAKGDFEKNEKTIAYVVRL